MTDTTPYTAHGDQSVLFAVDCPSRPILDQIADKWSMMALAVLQQPTRFNEIKRRLDGVTQRVLTQTLRRLERNGMITRRIIPTSPIGVEYALTPLGESLLEPFGRLYDWTIEHASTIRAAQADYDAEPRPFTTTGRPKLNVPSDSPIRAHHLPQR
ncbi:winged helix-turn-helix transcriptional regulator [Streptomyces sp. NPDC056987]|uniref:winged helix-turn-helix transcriptional regulator n=1 Tax=Streptomyces sp. NPDC056987 TaxID=3345988 RepID=UPI003630EC9F